MQSWNQVTSQWNWRYSSFSEAVQSLGAHLGIVRVACRTVVWFGVQVQVRGFSVCNSK